MAWFGLVWHGMVWFGLAWLGLAWLGLSRLVRLEYTYDFLERQRATGDIASVVSKYDGTWHPAVAAGLVEARDVKDDLAAELGRLQANGGGGGVRGGGVSRAHFLEVYKDMSYMIEGDDFFELAIRNAWHFAPEKKPRKPTPAAARGGDALRADPASADQGGHDDGANWHQKPYLRGTRRSAALTVQKVTRGLHGRSEATAQRRRLEAKARQREEEAQEALVEGARPRIRRSHVKTTHGF